VDVPTAKYVAVNTAAEPPIAEPNWWITDNAGGAGIMCRLSAYQEPFTPAKLRELYGSARTYRRQVEARLDALEAAGWSLPLYRDMILADAQAVAF
jgi:hypothetical protein